MCFPKLLPVFLTIVSLVLVSDFQVAKADHGGFHALPRIIIEKPPQRLTVPQTIIGDACPVNLPQRCPPGYTCRHIKRPDQRNSSRTIDPEYACVFNAGNASCPPGFTMRMEDRQTRGRTVTYSCTSTQMADPMQWCNSVQSSYMGYYELRNGELEFICGREG